MLMTISEGALKTLLVRQNSKHWALPCDVIAYNEDLAQAAERVIREQVGVSIDYLEQLYTFGNSIPPKGGREIVVAYFGLTPSVLLRSDKLADRASINWFSGKEHPPLTGNHAAVLHAATDRLRGKLAYTAVGFELLPERFSLTELQNLYEVILDKVLDKRNFRKKIIELGILEPVSEERGDSRGRGRPAAFFRFKPEVFKKIKTKGDIFHF